MRISDWSSDVCSSDLVHLGEQVASLGSVPDEGALLVQRNEMPSGHVEREPRPVRHARVAQMNANPREQLVDDDRLADIVDTALFERRHRMFGLGQAGHEDNRYMRKGRIGLD